MEKTYIQITSGRGPVECCRVVVLIMQKIIEQARELGLGTELVEHEDGPQSGCMFSATLSVKGDDTNLLTDEGSIVTSDIRLLAETELGNLVLQRTQVG